MTLPLCLRPPRALLRRLLAALLLGPLAPAVLFAQDCTATMTDVDFGSVALTLGGAAPRTTGTLTLSCTANGNRDIRACLDFGPGSGGTLGSGLRLMQGPAGSPPLPFSLRGESFSGPEIDTVEVDVPMSGGSGTISLGVFAELAPGTDPPPPGAYATLFADAGVSFGRGTCRGFGRAPLAPFEARVELVSSCSVTAGALDFGVLRDPESGADATAALSVLCTPGTAYSLGMGPGNGPAVTAPEARQMTSGADTLDYGIYLDPARSQPWGDATGTGGRAPGTGTGGPQDFTAYGRIPAGQSPPVGSYTDTVVVTVEY